MKLANLSFACLNLGLLGSLKLVNCGENRCCKYHTYREKLYKAETLPKDDTITEEGIHDGEVAHEADKARAARLIGDSDGDGHDHVEGTSQEDQSVLVPGE